MKITGIHIDGFGIFCDVSITDLPDGLVLFHGENEAGKSTLLGFVRAMLFGFPRKNAKEPDYPPLHGGQHGGRLVVAADNGGTFTVERHKGKKGVTVHAPDGTAGGEEQIRRLLGGASEPMFKNVYAFSLNELQVIDSLNKEGVTDEIYGAGAGVAVHALPNALSTIDGRLDKLFKPKGSKQHVNQLLGELEQVRKDLRDAVNSIGQYDEKTAELREIEGRIDQIQKGVAKCFAERDRVASHLRLWEDWIVLGTLETKLEPLPVVQAFPEKGLDILDRELDTIREKEAELVDLEDQLDQARSDAERYDVDEQVLVQAEAIELLERGRQQYAEARRDLPRKREAQSGHDTEIRRHLSALGTDWTEQRVCGLDRSLFTREAIRTNESELNALAEVRARAEHDLATRTETAEIAEQEAQLAEDQLEALRHEEMELDESVVHALRSRRDQIRSITDDLPALETQRDAQQEQLERTLREIHPDWTSGRLDGFDVSVSARQAVLDYEERLTAARVAVDRAQAQLHERKTLTNELHEKVRVARGELERVEVPRVKSLDALRQRRAWVQTLGDALHRRDTRENEIRRQQERIEDKNRERSRFGTDVSASIAGSARLPAVIPGLIGLLTVAGVITAKTAFPDAVSPVILLIAIPVGIVLIGAALYLFGQQRPLGTTTGLDAGTAGLLEDIRNEIASVETVLEQRRGELESVNGEIAALSERLALQGPASFSEVTRLEAFLDSDADILEERRLRQRDLDVVNAEAKRLEQAMAEAAERLEAARTEQSRRVEAWETHLEGLGLPATMTPQTALTVFSKVEAAVGLRRALADEERRIAKMVETERGYRELAAQIPSLGDASELSLADLLSRVDQALARWDEHQEQRKQFDVAHQRLAERRARSDEARQRLEEARDALDKAKQAEDEGRRQWESWIADHDLPAGLSPSTALEALGSVEGCIAAIDRRDSVRQEAAAFEKGVAAYETDAFEVFAALGRRVPDGDSVVASVAGLHEELNVNRETYRQRQVAQGGVSSLTTQIDNGRKRLAQCHEEVEALYVEADVADEAAFRERGRVASERARLAAEIEQTERKLLAVAGHQDLDALRMALEALSREELLTSEKGLALELEGFQDDLERLRNTRAERVHEVERLQSADDVARLRADEGRLVEQIRSAALEWARFATARHLIDRAREQYEREQQPKVIRDAQAFFGDITDGRYTELIAPVGRDIPEVITPDGVRKTPGQLSRGAAEQLYLAIRFGYIRNRAEGGEPLPVVMDDILVNFDPDRARNAGKAILELSRTHQILFFTCHPEMLDLFHDLHASVPTYTFNQGRIEPRTF